MKKLFRPAALLFSLLVLLNFFLLGLFFAKWIEAGKNQGLAGGAIVLGYGVLFGFIALVLAFIIGCYLKSRVLIKLNILFMSTLVAVSVYIWLTKKTSRRVENDGIQPKSSTLPPDNSIICSTALWPIKSNEPFAYFLS